MIIGKENKSNIEYAYNQLSDIDISVTTTNFETFKDNVVELYKIIVENSKHRGEVYINEIKTPSSTKYKIFGPGIPRPIDIFRIPYHPSKMVKKFHVNVVKMYYDGEVKLFRSCVSALLSGVNESYKWFSCNKVPADVLLKYAQRGFSIILNKKEKENISNFMKMSDRWSKILKFLDMKPDKIYCTIKPDHTFFDPSEYNGGIRFSLRNFRKKYIPHNNKLITKLSSNEFEFGSLPIRENNKIYPPNIANVIAGIDYIESREALKEID